MIIRYYSDLVMQTIGYQNEDYGGAVTPTSPRRVQPSVKGEGSWVSGDSQSSGDGAQGGKYNSWESNGYEQETIQMSHVHRGT